MSHPKPPRYARLGTHPLESFDPVDRALILALLRMKAAAEKAKAATK